MASSSSSSTSSNPKSFKYDVFLSFRGKDTRKTFVDHLYYALQQKSLRAFKDDERIKKGKRISDELIKSIEDSKIFIIVFSKNYASSSWCLEELVKIMECQKMTQQIAYPIFYDVEPSEIRKQSGVVGEVFATHKNEERAWKWREALKEASDLTGWELKNTLDGHEAKFIKKIVEHISLELRSLNLNIDENLIGMEQRIKDLESCFGTGFDGVHMIGIKGMGGGGKTTLARAFYDHVSIKFEGKSFVENIREVSKASSSGLKLLQKQVLSDVLNDQGITISDVYAGKNMIKNVMCSRKVLVVLDDVDNIRQLEALVGEPNWFKQGSLIIITTRDEQVLVAHKVKFFHDVSLLTNVEALCLFSRYAFGIDIPPHDYETLSLEVVRYAAGLPLTIKVLGSFLCGKIKLEWIDALERLKTIPLKETLEVLELSYNSLEDDYKEIFLDVACFLKWYKKDDAIRMLESCGFHARNGLRVLQQKSLITISQFEDDEYLSMHDHIQEMGRNIVRRLNSEEPTKHSRLWICEEVEHVLANDLGSEAIRCIKLSRTQLSPEVVMKGIRNMQKLRCLIVYSKRDDYWCDLKDDEASQCFPNGLRYLRWIGYPYQSLPETFGANSLVGLDISSSIILQLWKGGQRKVLNKLRFLDLSDSYGLMTLDLGLTPNIETLRLARCRRLVELRIHVGCLKLRSIDLDSLNMRTLDLTVNLETLRLEKCHNLLELHMPAKCLKLRSIDLNSSKIRNLDLGPTPNLETLRLSRCHDLVNLHIPIECLKLRFIDLNSWKLKDLHLTQNLEKLNLEECHDLVDLHLLNRCLKLKSIDLNYSRLRALDLGLTPNMVMLKLTGCHDLVELQVHVTCLNLRTMDLNCLKLKTLDLRLTPNLKTLRLLGCPNLVEVHMLVECLTLTSTHIRTSKLRTLDLTPNLNRLSLEQCHHLVELHMPSRCLELRSIELNCSKLRTLDLGFAPNLEMLKVVECHGLEELCIPVGCVKLRYIELTSSKLRSLDLKLTQNLEVLIISRCHDLVDIHMPIVCIKLISIDLSSTKLRTLDLGLSSNLETLRLVGCHDLEDLHMPIECLKLISINLNSSKLRILDLGMASNLETITLEGCHDLVELMMPVQCLKLTNLTLNHSKLKTLELKLTPNLKTLSLAGCHDFLELKMPFKCPNLKDLNFNHTKLRTLDLGLTPNLQTLSLGECHDLVNVDAPFGCLKRLAYLDVSGCSLFKSFVLKKQSGSHEFHLSAESLDIWPFKSGPGLPKFWFTCVYKQEPSSSARNLQNLISLGLSHQTNLEFFLESICGLRLLRKLTLDSNIPMAPNEFGEFECLEELILLSTEIKNLPDSICLLKHLKSLKLESRMHLEKLPKNIGHLECLEKLHLVSTRIKHLPRSICMLKRLKYLELESCWLLEKLPEDLGQLECLEFLILMECVFLEDVPNSICKMKHLKHFHLPFCSRVEKLPEELGRLESLRELDVKGTGITSFQEAFRCCKACALLGLDGYFSHVVLHPRYRPQNT